jgi:hypothetical protein
VPDTIITWTVTHRRPLDDGEDPTIASAVDESHLLWALEDGEVATSIQLVEP